MKKYITIITILLVTIGFSQTKTISGTIVDENNLPLPGATILVKGTTNGTSSDFDGKYTIKADVGDILVFNYVGYATQEIPVGSSNTIDIAMQQDNNLDEVVVAAYGISNKKTFQPTASQIKRRETKAYKQSIANALQGRSSGVIVAAEDNVSVRSTNAKDQPLYIVDGQVIPKNQIGYIAKLDKSLIENVQVYKSRKAVTKFGKAAKHGAIIITTHKGNYRVENDESYSEFEENDFKTTQLAPLSTFSIDVDKASYSNVRRMINNGQNIQRDVVKIEEFVNYFTYDYPQPKGKHPFSITTEIDDTPWHAATKLVRIGLQGKSIAQDNLPASNLVFLIDVSGSMSSPNKLGLLKKAFKYLTNQLREKDKVAIVVYAGAAGVVLESTSGLHKQRIMEALDDLQAGGSTAGGAGINLAYKIAQQNFIKNGNNRVILATDGDFNVGASSDKDMKQLIEEKRKSGVFLTCLGFGYGNYKDSKLETLADKGNGNHAYIDNMQEAQKMFGKEFGGTLYTIAKDVKIQVEFNPNIVKGYRLIGYENRLLNDEDFIDDTKDAGELGSGHTVTALYEVVLQGTKSEYFKNIPELKYTQPQSSNQYGDELLTVKFRYKKPDGDKSIEMVEVLNNKRAIYNQQDFNFSSAVALLGMKLRKSKYCNNADYKAIIALAERGRGKDKDGYRAEFIRLVKTLQ